MSIVFTSIFVNHLNVEKIDLVTSLNLVLLFFALLTSKGNKGRDGGMEGVTFISSLILLYFCPYHLAA